MSERHRNIGSTTATARRVLPVTIVMIVLAVLVLLPLGTLLVTSFLDAAPRPGSPLGTFTLENYRALLTSGTRIAATNTAVISLLGTIAALAIGAPMAWLAARTDVPGRALIEAAGFVPLFMSALVGSLAWSLVASPRAGYINLMFDQLGIPWQVNIYSVPGMVLVFALYYAPYSFIFVYGALSLMNPELEEAARVHGARRSAVVFRITAPLMVPAVMASSLLTFVLISENFPVVQILGLRSGVEALPSRIFRLMVASPPNPNQAAAIGALFTVIVFGCVYIQNRVLRRRSYVTITGKGMRPHRVQLGRLRWVGFGFGVTYLLLAVGVPLFALIQSSLRQNQFIRDFGSLFDTSAFSFENFRSTLSYGPFQEGLINTAIVALATAILGGILFFTAAFIVYRTNLPGRRLLNYVTVMPLAMPALVLGMGFLWTWIRSPVPVYGTLIILVLAFCVRFMPQGYQGVSNGLIQIHPDMEDSAYTLGASRVRAARSITLPLVKKSVFSAMMLVFILSFRELSAALFLFTTDTRMLSIVIYDVWESGRWPTVAAMSLVYSLVLFVVAVVGRRFFGLGKV